MPIQTAKPKAKPLVTIRTFRDLPRADVADMRAKILDRVLASSVEALMRHPKVKKVSLGGNHHAEVRSKVHGAIEPWYDMQGGIGIRAKGYAQGFWATLFVYFLPQDRDEVEAFMAGLPEKKAAATV